jgi:hypothetical protein
MHNTGTMEDGLAVYSMREHASLNFDLMLHKSYFSGQSPTPTNTQCDNDIVQRGETQGPVWLYDIKSRDVDEFYMSQNELRYIDTLRDLENCHAISIPGGSNALMINNQMEASLNTRLLQTLENNAVLVVQSDNEQTLTTELRTIDGSILRKFGTTNLTVGETEIPLDLNGLSLATGVYFIVWSNGSETGTQQLIIR